MVRNHRKIDSMTEVRDGYKLVANLGDDRIVDMINYQDEVLVATERGIFRLRKGVMTPIMFEVPVDD